MDFDKVLDKILSKLNELSLQGEFKFSIDSLDNIDKVDKIIEDVLKEEGYYKNLNEYKKEFQSVLSEVVGTYKSFGAQITPELKAYNNAAFKLFYNNLAINVTDTNIKQPIKQALLQYIASDGTFKGFKETVKDIFAKNKIEADVNKIAREYVFQYKRAQGQIIANKLGIKYFQYFGGEIDTTRCFCQERNGNVYSVEEIKSWAKLDWNGKIKGTNENNITMVLGGYSCLHSLLPVSDRRAESGIINNYNKVDCELK